MLPPSGDKRLELHFGPYRPPRLKKGDRAACLYRDADVVVASWSDAPISWPRGYAPSGPYGRGTGLVVDEELARAVRGESALAVCHWWRVGRATVSKWRRALGVTKRNNEGTHALVRAAAAAALEVALEVGVSEGERGRRARLMREMRLWERGPRVTSGKEWTAEEEALLGAMPDPEAARRTGHTLNAARIRRRLLGRPRFREGPPAGAVFEPRTGRWYAAISVRGRKTHLGTFATKEEAGRAYRAAAAARAAGG